MEYTNKRKNSFELENQTLKYARLTNYTPILNPGSDNNLLSSTPSSTPLPHNPLSEVARLEDDTMNLTEINDNILTQQYNHKRQLTKDIDTEEKEMKKSKNVNYNNNQLQYNEENITNKVIINELSDNEYFVDYLKIGTINIGSAYQNKKNDIINYFVTHNYDILGITETGYQKNMDYRHLEIVQHPYVINEKIFIIHDTNGETKGSGVSIMMTQQIYQHNHSSSHYEGRICNIRLGFKGRKTLDITCCYLPASSNKDANDMKNRCVNEINRIIKHYKTKNYFAIIMGDFNCSPKDATNINHQVITTLKGNNFTDLAKFHAIDKTPEITHKVNRIDYQFGNNEILKNSIHTFTQGVPLSFFKTDHKAVITLLDRSFWSKKKFSSNKPSTKILKKQKEYKPAYDKMTPDLWAIYKDQSKRIFTGTFKKLKFEAIQDMEYLDHVWNKIENCIHKIKKDYIVQKPVFDNTYNRYPLDIRQLNNHVIFLYRTKQFFNLKHICLRNQLTTNRNTDKLSIIPDDIWYHYFEKWPTYLKKIMDIVEHTELKIALAPKITKNNYPDQKQLLYSLYTTLKTLYQNRISKWTKDRIDFYINERNNNLTNNQTKMINSILQRKPRRIILDRLVYEDKNNNTVFTNNPDIITEQCIHHYQNIGKSNNHVIYNDLNDLPLEWQDIYDPNKNSISSDMWSMLELEITIEDILNVLPTLSKKKAPGPSKITNEDLIHLDRAALCILKDFYNTCIKLELIPSKWREALIFPIPKPTDWNCKLNNTRPITLLETTRKLMVTLISRKINNILSKFEILQWNNKAGVLGQSTLEPLFVIQHLIELAKNQNQELWIVIQDLSKAYDRVDISLLTLALRRIKIPQKIITFLINLFKNRQNSIILQDGRLGEYKVLQGIDQGEVISPLLWNIYYDPMFHQINKREDLMFKCSTTRISNILHRDRDIIHEFSTSVIGYLDDTTWFGSSLQQLNDKLSIANSFYDLAKIKINEDKYKIMNNIKKHSQKRNNNTQGNEDLNQTLTINGRIIKAAITPYNKGERVLGIYINAHNRQHQTLSKGRSIVQSHYIMLARQKITHDHMAYIINKIILPKLEYIFQHTILNFSQSQKLMAPLKRLFKKSLRLPLNTSDNIIYNRLFPCINNFFDLQVKSQLNMISALLNTPSLNMIVLQKLDIMSHEIWYPTIPDHMYKYVTKTSHMSYLTKSLELISLYNFNISLTFDRTIIGGNTPIRDYLPNLTNAELRSLQKKKILYMDQLVSADGRSLLTWNEVKINNEYRYKGIIPNWFKNLENNYTISNLRTLTIPLNDPVTIPNRLHKTPTISLGITMNRFEWTIHWDNNTRNVIFGKTLMQDTVSHSSITYLEHYIPISVNDPIFSQLPSNQVPLILTPCNGCSMNSYYPSADTRPTCVITKQTRQINIFKVHKSTSSEHKFFSKTLKRTKYQVSTKPLHSLKHVAYTIYLQRAGISANSLSTPASPNLTITNKDLINSRRVIDTSIICNDMIKCDLKNIASNFADHHNFHFYTDGSVKALGSQQCKSGFGWIQVSNDSPKCTFSGSTVFFPSSYKSESMAILTALLTLPSHSIVKISTDSANCIHTFNQRINSPVISPRKQLKQNNFLIWDLIFWLIHYKELALSFTKVKAHSNDDNNDKADQLASKGATNQYPIIVNYKFFAKTHMGFINWNNIYVIDRNVRKWAENPIQATMFNSLVNNTSMQPIHEQISDGAIDWYFTHLWIHYNSTSLPTSEKLSMTQGQKIKKSNFLYPTSPILQRNYPKLYPTGIIKCAECNSEADTSTHVSLCVNHIKDLNRVLSEYKTKLGALLLSHTNTFTFDLRNRLNNSLVFKEIPLSIDSGSNVIPRSLPGLLLLYNLIPIDLTSLFYNYIGNKKSREDALLKFLDDFIRDLNHVTWRQRTKSFKVWERSMNISRNDKKFYRQRLQRKKGKDTTREEVNKQNIVSNDRNTFHVHRLPYEKHLITFNDKSHIRWTSSNFLHSGSWESHRDELLFNTIDDTFYIDLWCSLGR